MIDVGVDAAHERHPCRPAFHASMDRLARSPRSPATSPAQYPAGSGVGVSVLLRQPGGFEGFLAVIEAAPESRISRSAIGKSSKPCHRPELASRALAASAEVTQASHLRGRALRRPRARKSGADVEPGLATSGDSCVTVTAALDGRRSARRSPSRRPSAPERRRSPARLKLEDSAARSPRSPATSPAQYPAGSGVGVSVLLRQPHGFEGFGRVPEATPP